MRQGIIITGFIYILSCLSCTNTDQGSKKTYTSGSSTVVADESFTPIVEDQMFVFGKSYPEANIKVVYRPENKLLSYFLNDSARVAIMSRKLSAEEKKVYENKKIRIRVNRFAVDGIALISHESVTDSTITVEEIISIMKGQGGKRNLVFDNANSSTVRYLKELSGIKELPKSGIYALQSNPEVIKFVHNNPGSIGVIGINWIQQPADKEIASLVGDLRIMGVKNTEGKPGSDNYYQPSQNNLALGLYALTRDLFIIDCEGGPGPGAGLAAFIAGERGQRIVLKSGLLPDKIPSREIVIRSKL